MKKLNLIVAAAGLFILAGILSFKQDSKPGKTIMIKALQSGTTSYIMVYKGSKQTEKFNLDPLPYDQMLTLVQTYEKEGYKLVSHTELQFPTTGLMDTFILSKY